MVPRPVEQVVEEVEQAGIGPLHILEDEYDGVGLCEALEQHAPRREKVLLVPRDALLEPEQVGETRLDARPLVRVGKVLAERLAELLARGGRLLVLDDPAAHAHHLGQRPVRDALPVGEAAAAVPPRLLGEAVLVLLELPGEPRLADPGDPHDRNELCSPLVCRRVEELLDEPELALAAHERRFEARRAQGTRAPGDHAQRLEELNRLRLALQVVRACVVVGDCSLAGPLRGLSDEDGSGLGGGLDARRGVDQVAGDHPLIPRVEGHRGLAGEDAGAGLEVGRVQVLAQR